MKLVRFRPWGGVATPSERWPRAFLLTREDLFRQELELQPLRLHTFAVALVQGWWMDAVRAFQRACWRVGFLDVREGAVVAKSDWRWRWWRPRAGVHPRATRAR